MSDEWVEWDNAQERLKRNARQKKYRRNNLEKSRKASRDYMKRTYHTDTEARRRRLASAKKWAQANKDKQTIYQRRKKLKSRYNLTVEQYQQMVESQKGLCAICLKKPVKLVIDHNHKTGKIRQLLCTHCNLALGHFEKGASVMMLFFYIERHG